MKYKSTTEIDPRYTKDSVMVLIRDAAICHTTMAQAVLESVKG